MIFIADDSDPVRERLTALLSDIEGAEVVGQAKNAAEAIEGVRSLNPDLVILDIQMPGGNGIDVLKAIKRGPSPPLVMMLTNHAYPQYRKKCMALGADFFLDKSKDLERLAAICASMVQAMRADGATAG
ncbi:MAG TPA: response regulator transcription factor [Pyrinomonadaceae bacterium]